MKLGRLGRLFMKKKCRKVEIMKFVIFRIIINPRYSNFCKK
jgi:hypothetical protein